MILPHIEIHPVTAHNGCISPYIEIHPVTAHNGCISPFSAPEMGP